MDRLGQERHLAHAVAASPHISTLAISGPCLTPAYHSGTEGKLREVFREARGKTPCVVTNDVDALRHRRKDGAGGEAEKRVVATLLTGMDAIGEASWAV
ncbi:hypothetical protein BU17DRAFT_85043 [Hysterangium stoloniferum]|nr:hypothetical protein BU17DRAFT_85043 [Hysterangium stoloniferum]